MTNFHFQKEPFSATRSSHSVRENKEFSYLTLDYHNKTDEWKGPKSKLFFDFLLHSKENVIVSEVLGKTLAIHRNQLRKR